MSASRMERAVFGLPPRLPAPFKGHRRQPADPDDWTPLSWDQFFDHKLKVDISEGECFNVYRKGDSGLCFVFIHGGGYSGLSWACLTEILVEDIECQIVAMDLRGHGDTMTADEVDLSTETLVRDIFAVLNRVFPDEVPVICLMGHSMGGALAVHVASWPDEPRITDRISALCVVDVVEGSAMDALRSMHAVLRSRPDSFPSMEKAIEWCVRGGTVRNRRSARVSMPGQVRQRADDSTVEWRINLVETEPHWAGWFQGLSDKFLQAKPAKLLLLAGVDRLDKALTVGQMQGKFQMVVLPKVGHTVHEDNPEKVAEVLSAFCVRFKLTRSKHGDQLPTTAPL